MKTFKQWLEAKMTPEERKALVTKLRAQKPKTHKELETEKYAKKAGLPTVSAPISSKAVYPSGQPKGN
jgi:hypothetical protein